MNIGATEFAVLLASAVSLGIAIWAIVDAAGHPQSSWTAIGKSKPLWITLIAVFTFACGIIGLVLAIVYLASIRPELRNVAV